MTRHAYIAALARDMLTGRHTSRHRRRYIAALAADMRRRRLTPLTGKSHTSVVLGLVGGLDTRNARLRRLLPDRPEWVRVVQRARGRR